MSIIHVFREGASWRYSVKKVVSPERFDTKDEAQFAAEQAAVQILKEEDEKVKEKAVVKEEKVGTKDIATT